MDINITKFFNDGDHFNISGSCIEHGPDAGAITWNNAKQATSDYGYLDTEKKREAFRVYIKGFGAWSAEEISAEDDCELNALFLQMVAGDIREVPDMKPGCWDWEEYERLANVGTISGRFYRGGDGDVYYYIGD